MFVKTNLFNKIVRAYSLKMLNKIENNGNCNFDTNGEKAFINRMFEYFSDHSYGEMTFFDIGANVGEYTKMLLDQCQNTNQTGSIHLFEPTSYCFNQLKGKYDNKKEIILNKKAVSATNGTTQIFYDQQGSGLASLYKRDLKVYNIELNLTETIETIRLDEYIDEHNIKHISFIKIDIEGHELEALRGMGKCLNSSFIDFIQFEYGGANLDSGTSLNKLFEILELSGFIIAKIMPKGLEIRQYQPFMENFFYSNYVAISNQIVRKIQ